MQECKTSAHFGKKFNRQHNTREYNRESWNKDDHINYDRTSKNITLVDCELRDFFQEHFSEALAEYNERNKEKHPERVQSIQEFYQKNKKYASEIIMQLGDSDTYKSMVQQLGERKADEFYSRLLTNTLDYWREKNPSLKVFGAYVHMDEATPHLHLDYLPIAQSSRGMSLKVSTDGALKEIGYDRKKDTKGNEPYNIRWCKDLHQTFNQFCQAQCDSLLGKDFINVLASERSTKAHEETWQYREKQKALAKVSDFVTGKGHKKIEMAQEIIDNAKQINSALLDEGDKKMEQAQKLEKQNQRRENLIEKTEQRLKQQEQTNVSLHNRLLKKEKNLNTQKAKIDIRIEKEVNKRLEKYITKEQCQNENERYKNARISEYAEYLNEVEHQKKKGRFER